MTADAALREFLPRTPFFGGLDEPQLDLLISMLVRRDFRPGEAVMREGEMGRSMWVIRAGSLVVYKRGQDGHEVKMVRLGAGDFCGEMALIEVQPRSSTVLVEAAAELYELTNMDLLRLYQRDVAAYVMVLQNINRELCRRLRRADFRITEFATEFGGEDTQIKSLRPR